MKEFITRNIQGGLIAVQFLFSQYALAQAPNAAGVSTAALEATSAAKNWSVPVSFEYASSLHRKTSYERKVQESVTVIPTYKISKGLKASLMTSVYRDDSNDEAGGTAEWDNTRLSLTSSQTLFTKNSWNLGVSATIPTNRNLRDQTSYHGGLSLSTGVSISELFWGSSLQYRLSFGRNFHEYNIAATGGFNVRETLGNSLEYSIPFSESLSLQTTFVYTAGKTYEDDLRTKFVTEASVAYQATEALSLAAGTSNEGNALGPNGVDSNIEFFNDTSSMIKLGLTYIM